MNTSPDANKNTRGEKSYSLRPRAMLKKEEEESDQEEWWQSRGRAKRRCRQRGVALSKYRRKRANARERERMREINDAFRVLRRALPLCSPRSENCEEKTSKIMTLRLAMQYISALHSALLISDSSTPTSTSQQSAHVFEPLFITTTLDDCSPPLSSSNSAISLFIDSLKSSSLHTTSAGLNVRPRKVPTLLTGLTGSSLQSQLLTDCSLPVDDSLSPFPLQHYVSTTCRELDCLPSPPIDLADILFT